MKYFITKSKILLILWFLSSVGNLAGQTEAGFAEIPYIEVTGSAYQEVIPDEIYINIIIREKYVSKEKITIEKQEEQLKTYLNNIGVKLNDLYLSDANADYVKVKWRTKDLLTKKYFTLKVADAVTVGQVFQQLDQLDITDAYIAKVNHSKIDSLEKVVKIRAIKDAKDKSDYLLNSIGEQTGKPLIIQEHEKGIPVTAVAAGISIRGGRTDGTKYYIDGVRVSDNEDKLGELQFKKIKIESFIYVKFAIK